MTRISSKNQITIPVDVLRETGLEPGDEVDVRTDGRGRLAIARRRDVLREVAGSMPDVWPPGAIEQLRREWDR
jgi:AbrB family looped-hinge helix DNA binding protein